MKRKKTIILLIIILTVLVVGFFCRNYFSNKTDEFVYSGTAEADKINVSSEISGRISDIKVIEGSKIKAGDLVVTLGIDDATSKLQDAEINIKNSENELGKITEGAKAEEIRSQQDVVKQMQTLVKQGELAINTAENNVGTATSNYTYKKKIYDDALALYEKGVESKYKVDTAKMDLDTSLNSLDNSKNALATSKSQLQNSLAQLDAANEKLNLIVTGATNREKNSAGLAIEKSKNAYELSKINVAKGNIISSVDALVETINYKKGEVVTPSIPIVTLLDLNNIWVKIYVPEKALPDIKLNSEVNLTNDFIKNKTIKGKIIYISPEAEFTPVNVVTKKDRAKLVYAIKVKIMDTSDLIKPGMLFDVKIK